MKENNSILNFTNLKEDVPWKITDVLFTYIFIFSFSLVLIGLLIITGVNTDSSLFPVYLQILLSAATIGTIYYFVSKKYRLSFKKTFGFNLEKTPSYIIQGIGVSFLIVISTTVISIIFSEIIGVKKQSPYVSMPEDKLKMLSIMAVLIAPAVEEIFFRGFMQPVLVKNMGVWGGVLLTAIIFGLSHSQYLDYSVAIIAVTTIGLILGATRQITGSVMPGIFAHLINNLLAAINLQ